MTVPATYDAEWVRFDDIAIVYDDWIDGDGERQALALPPRQVRTASPRRSVVLVARHAREVEP